MVKKLITEISEEDFRKLNLKGYRHERVQISARSAKFVMSEVNLNDVLDSEIKSAIENGYESDLEDLKCPVTIAIHEEPTESDYEKIRQKFPSVEPDSLKSLVINEFTYLDKFMNRFTGAQTYQFGWGIKHLYSTRDYYECHGDYWKVRKDETKVIYRIRLSDHWADEFVLKHKYEIHDWPYETLPRGCDDVSNVRLKITYDNVNGEWVDIGRCAIVKNEYSTACIPIDKDGKEIH